MLQSCCVSLLWVDAIKTDRALEIGRRQPKHLVFTGIMALDGTVEPIG